MAEITFEHLTKIYPGGIRAVADLDLRVAAGELLVLVGPSGCGKTTTLRLLAGLEAPTEGVIRIDGKDMARVLPHKRDLAMVFQRPALYPHLTVQDNLAFALALRRVPRKLRQQQVRDVATRLQIDDILERYPAELSGGQQQRVALGRALAQRPRILLLDEPLANLDTCLRADLRRELHLLHAELGATMLCVTHDPIEAMSLGDRLTVMNSGRLEQVGAPSEVYSAPKSRFVAALLGWPPMNFIDGTLTSQDGRLRFCAGGFSCTSPLAHGLAGRRVTVGIRPEDVDFDASADNEMVCSIAQVELVEPLGNNALVTVRLAGCRVLGIWRGQGCQSSGNSARISVGQEVRIGLPMNRCHWFDFATGVALAGIQAG